MKKSAPACRIEGARTHNLKAVHCEIPFGKLTAVTGVSGSGKSTLAFDVLYAEGQRRFVDCLSTYARQFLQRLDRPDVDRIGEIQPPIALKQQVSIRNARSTVGSITELSDLLHLLFAHGGTPHCPKDGTELVLHTAESAAAELRTLGASRKFVLTASVQLPSQRSPRARNAKGVAKGEGKGEVKGDAKREGKGKVPTTGGLAAAVALGYQEQGYSRVYRDGEVQEWQEPYRGGENQLVVDRFTSRSLSRSRALEAIESAWKLASGRADVWELGDTKPLTTLTEGLSCPNCHERTRPLRPQLFSPNSPLGACPECNGFGRIVILDRDKVVPDGSLSLDNGAVVPFETKTGRLFRRAMLAEAKARGIPTDVPFRELSEAEKDWVFEGTPLEKKSRSRSKSGTSSGEDPRTNLGTKSEAKLGTKSDYTSAAAKTRATGRRYRGVEGLFKKLERKRYRPHVRIFLARFRGYETCPRCRGSRLHPVALSVTVGGLDLAQMEQMPVAGLLSFLDELDLGMERTARVRLVLDEVRERLRYLDEVGLGYLMLARTARTLSGGETQRIRLASGLGTSLTETLYVLDEPTVGLHAADTARMLEILRHLCASGNTAVVVEHDPGIVLHADHLIVLGPSGGEGGGEIVYEGSTKEFVRRHPDFFRVGGAVNATKAGTTGSITTARSTTETTATATATATTSTSAAATTAPIRFRGIQQHNLVIDALDLPTDRLVVVTGVSGSGKSTLIEDVLYRNALRQFGKPVEDIGRVRELTGLEPFAEVLLVSQNPLGRSSRSTLISYTGLLASVRKRLAATPRATELGLRPGDFSFNVPGGRCETCKGMGSILLE
ncbi:MAG: hypothetical protein KDA27_18065, partial [Candidatus Eisenbacteria bacterium]|nr:hypothetical protein [Candidatus Eisenbacteria bacterium]